MEIEGKRRVVIENVVPEIDGGVFPAKRAVGEPFIVRADIFADGHQRIDADLLWRKDNEKRWQRVPMRFLWNDLWEASFIGDEIGSYYYAIEAWVDHFQTWQHDLKKKHEAEQDLTLEILIGTEFLKELFPFVKQGDLKILKNAVSKLEDERVFGKVVNFILDPSLTIVVRRYSAQLSKTIYEKNLSVVYMRKKALFSSWYECFPRSFGSGSLANFTKEELPKIAAMGFDVLYLPPIHPIGLAKRKGKNNSPIADIGSIGSPWAIGRKEGGHDAIDPSLGTLEDFYRLMEEAKRYGLEIAMDLAFQCSPDHPYEKAHPEWFRWRPDGTVQYAENPPKKYEDIIPFHFETDAWPTLWEELKRVVLYWIRQGVRIFRVDNPHTKPFIFWQWLIGEAKKVDPEIIFLSEAFTRPKIMYYLAKIGFDQSYTYFTWRNTKHALIDYMKELMQRPLRDFFRPNFWPNTPDILPDELQHGGRPAFMARFVLAATLSSNYGIYGPPYELCISQAVAGKEEYLDSEKYEVRKWDRDQPGNICDFIALINRIRKENIALQTTWNIEFLDIGNDQLICYAKWPDLIIVVNLDYYHTQSGVLSVPLEKFGLLVDKPFLVHDLLTDDKYLWEGANNYIELRPQNVPAHILKIHSAMHREQTFDSYM